jgi:ketosteroid isomerase-like protein
MTPTQQHSERSSETAVVDAVEQMTRAFESGDIERVMQAYDDGAVIAFEPGKPVADRPTIREPAESPHRSGSIARPSCAN